jgi:glycosyltransferase involved in cell wall biosynthesis
MKNALVSVVVPFFNHADYIVDALDSVCRQTHRNLQIIAVDDGSTDGSGSMVLGHFGDRVELVTQENLGPSASVNTGLRHAKGDFIALLGGDDLCLPARIENQLKFMIDGEHDIVFSVPHLIDRNGRSLDQSKYEVFFRKIEPGQSIFRSLLLEDNFLCAPSALMRASVVRDLGYFHEGLIQLQDYDYWLRAGGQGYDIAIMQEPQVSYRRHIGNLSSERRTLPTLTEISFVVSNAIKQARPRILRKEFSHLFGVFDDFDAPLTAFERVLLLLAHPRDELRATGMTELMSLLNDEHFVAFAREQGLNVFQLLFNIGESMGDKFRPLELALRS